MEREVEGEGEGDGDEAVASARERYWSKMVGPAGRGAQGIIAVSRGMEMEGGGR